MADQLKLTFYQKVQLAANVFVIYWPLRFYITLESFDWNRVGPFIVCIWLLEIPITIALFTGWLGLTEWVENNLFKWDKRLFRRDGKLATQLATLLIAGMLSVGFDWAFFGLLNQARTVFDKSDSPISSPRTNSTRPVVEQNGGRPEPKPGRRAITALTIMALLMAYYLAANRRGDNMVAQLQLKGEQLKREAYQAQFDALKNQVNPHFLFNSLSILSSLVDTSPKLSIQFINQLSKAYRYILEQRDSQRVQLKTELEFLEVYCFLLTIRFADKLKLINTVSAGEALQFQIAPLTLQLLLENAVKHNRMTPKQPLTVTLSIQDNYLVISNPIQLRLPDEIFKADSTGIGLTNITNRYRLLTEHPVRVTQSDTTFSVSIPLL
ncbi:sensor histidine kinase [Spirosoma linguale]|uniref:Signal transduction histidine kinase, LytS n=1 Tax=Spirosoma linguale (strain ATCC 33905 / DSM 74 / LMG 10896 / Claus 1) TaxID=504472 RepID=D2QI07_SPILD|nr:signal transduction histidine kinase, LytS [Spirosoma linguale DSM 74]